ncbi:DsbA family protein [Mangrovibrevibacter kandeliae]|uniref:DsbA family protein n=1 Tax=Mangrovibrevibacter kandeliae TaxID=2968473 RepID=UPI002118CB32|nr:DsbA family protein [Aurantimonas sp. CSK15Z-1]MCQ8780749.1 DsbA family protein [Aurantimonas sp. CSK15Z-1]
MKPFPSRSKTRPGAPRHRVLALFFAGVAGLALAACSDEAKDSPIAAADATLLVAQADAPATDAPVTPAAEAPKPDGHADVEALMADQPLPDVVIGKADAPVTIIEYASMTCTHCRDFHARTYPVIKRDYLDTGKAKLILREFPFDPRALAAFMLARCAPGDKRTAMVDVLFDQQDTWARAQNASEALLQIGRLAGFTEESFKACLNDKDLQQKVVAVQQRGETVFGVNATPTFFVNGDKYAGDLSPEEMAAVIEAHAKK